MTLQQIRYVIAIANTSSMNEAAKKLFVSELKDEASAMNAILPVIRVYKLKEV